MRSPRSPILGHFIAAVAISAFAFAAMAAYAQEDRVEDVRAQGVADAVAQSEEVVAENAGLTQPKWDVGKTWTVESVSQRIQGREEAPARKPVPIRWQFRVAELENLAGRDCYRIEIECLARGRIRPKSMIWVDQKSGFLRQYKTELAVAGRMRPMIESYDHAKGAAAPIVTPVNALPIALPAFVAPGSKANSFVYTSAPMPAGAKAKDLGLVTFAHEVTQTATQAGPKALEIIPAEGRPKSIEQNPLTEVSIGTGGETITQIWQQGQPWPVFVDNGRTKAYLVSESE